MADEDAQSFQDGRRRLLAGLDLERNQLVRNIETCRIRDIDRPFIADWSLKDIVGHVATWEAEVVSALRELVAGRRPPLLDFDEAKLDAWNRDHVERKRDLNFWIVYEQLKGGRARLGDVLEEISDETLADDSSPEYRLIHSLLDHDRSHWHEIAAVLAGMQGARRQGPESIPAEANAS
ncbi:MAG: DinB family protein [Dehalococcoidia bacterium]